MWLMSLLTVGVDSWLNFAGSVALGTVTLAHQVFFAFLLLPRAKHLAEQRVLLLL